MSKFPEDMTRLPEGATDISLLQRAQPASGWPYSFLVKRHCSFWQRMLHIWHLN